MRVTAFRMSKGYWGLGFNVTSGAITFSIGPYTVDVFYGLGR